MGKHRKKQNWKDKRQNAKKINTTEEYSTSKLVLENKAFEAYYKVTRLLLIIFIGFQLLLKEEFETESDFNRFLTYLRQKLPVTFRINEDIPNATNFLEKIKHPDFISKMTAQTEEKIKTSAIEVEGAKETDNQEKKEGENDDQKEYESITEQIKLTNVPWYPRELVWELTTFRYELKRNKAYEKLHKFIQQANDSGLITRQELVSMLPPLLLDVQSTDIIFDMCAAPGTTLFTLKKQINW